MKNNRANGAVKRPTFQLSPGGTGVVWRIERIVAGVVRRLDSREADVIVNEEQMKKQLRRKAR